MCRVLFRRLFNLLTHWGRDKTVDISQTTFSNAFSWMKICEFRLIFHWSLFLRDQLTIFQHLFRKWLGAGQATSHYLNQWWLVYWRLYASLGLNELMNYGFGDTHMAGKILKYVNECFNTRVCKSLSEIIYVTTTQLPMAFVLLFVACRYVCCVCSM